MKLLNFGSLNIDYVYTMNHFVKEKETQAALDYARHVGGKGLNQSIALASAGQEVFHAGKIGEDGEYLRSFLQEHGVNTSFVKISSKPSGHAIIQVVQGENAIIVYGGANQDVDEVMIDEVLAHFSKGDMLLVQNEISSLDVLLEKAHAQGMKIALNPSPIDEKLLKAPLSLCDMLFLNEVEAATLADGHSEDYTTILRILSWRFPDTHIVLTCGEKGAYSCVQEEILYQSALSAPIVDTTCAGDTFTGFYLSALLRGYSRADALWIACKAASLSIQRAGAAISIPKWEEIDMTEMQI